MNVEKCHSEKRQGLDIGRLRPALAAEILTLERLVPDAGLAFVFKGYDGKNYLFANKRMPIPKHRKTHEIQGGETIVAFENGNIFSAIQFIVRGLAADFGMKKRIDLACAAITAIANLDQQGATRMAA